MSRDKPNIVVVGRQRAHEILLLAVSVVLGITYTVSGPQPGTVAALMNPALLRGWAVAMAVTGAAGLVGCYWRTRIETSLGMERGAMVAQLGALMVYAAAIVAYVGVRGLFAAAIIIGWAVANLVRTVQISRDLRALR